MSFTSVSDYSIFDFKKFLKYPYIYSPVSVDTGSNGASSVSLIAFT